MEEVDFDGEDSIKSRLGEHLNEVLVVHHTIPDWRTGEEVPFVSWHTTLNLQVLDVRRINARGELGHALDGIVQEPQEVPCVKVNPQVRRVHGIQQSHHLVRGEIDVIL